MARGLGSGRHLDAVIGDRLQIALCVVEQPQALDAGSPATVLADRDGHDVVACGIERGDHGGGGAKRDLVLSRPSTVQDADSHPRHASVVASRRAEDKRATLDGATKSFFRRTVAGIRRALSFLLDSNGRLELHPFRSTTHGSFSVVPSKTRSRL